MSMCKDCQGRGFTEFQSGTICISCETCNGIGEVVVPIVVFEVRDIQEDGGIKTKTLYDGLNEVTDDSNSGAEQPDTITRSRNPGEPPKPQKRKSKKAARKGSR